MDGERLPDVRVGEQPARVVFASPGAISATVPALTEGGRTAVRVKGVAGDPAYIGIAASLATGLHQVDNPAFDRDGNLYVDRKSVV